MTERFFGRSDVPRSSAISTGLFKTHRPYGNCNSLFVTTNFDNREFLIPIITSDDLLVKALFSCKTVT